RTASAQLRILGHEEIATGRWRRSAGNNELVRGEAWSLIGLEHSVPEGILFGECKIRLHVRWIHIHKLRICGRTVGAALGAADTNSISSVHRAGVRSRVQIAHLDKRRVGVAEIVIVRQVNRTQSYGPA